MLWGVATEFDLSLAVVAESPSAEMGVAGEESGAVASPNSNAFNRNLDTAARYISPGSFRKIN